MMKFCVVILAALFVVTFADDKYTTKYDDVDLDEIIGNKRLLNNYVNCLLDKGKCTPDGQELKNVLPDAQVTNCSKCNQKQRDGSTKILRHLIENEPELYSELEKKYDPTGEYRKNYLAERR